MAPPNRCARGDRLGRPTHATALGSNKLSVNRMLISEVPYTMYKNCKPLTILDKLPKLPKLERLHHRYVHSYNVGSLHGVHFN